ncbi:MAG TPA: Rrf2 family transcriptional regulator [Terriglobales bacterium]|nr:Rrf2 family transcriptional regulator [Terriglobales bacterium]
MQLTRAADYAVRVMIQLASLPPGTRVQRNQLAESTGVPESFMSKVLQALVRARLISSRRGLDGGFELMVSSDQVSLLDVVEAIEGPVQLNFCLGSGEGCERQRTCAAHFVWAEAQAAMVSVLKKATIQKLAQQTQAAQCLAGRREVMSPMPVANGATAAISQLMRPE